ncbi:piggyBac transposable element-derived protein 4 [Trichonephila clavipes]|nr:piggyBac transposable element-derived protein 4 [Trichonephila clavipes]
MNSDSENECLIEERSSDEEFSSSESESDDDCLDSARDWCQIDVTSPLPSHPKFPFTGNPGIKGSKMEKYEQGRDEKIYRSVAPTRRSTKTCGTEVLVEKTNSIHSIFGKVMGEVRYGLLMKFLHFANNESSSDLDHNTKLKKYIREFHNLIVHKFKSVYVPKPDISVDESLIAYKGRLSWKQYIPQKRARFGIKLFQLCESESGYIWNSLIYTGKGTAFNENYNDYGLSTKSALTLIHELKGKGYCLSTDNFYTSPELAELLIYSKTDICGTLRPNRKGLPVSFKSSTLKKGEIIAFQKGKNVCFKVEG